MPWILGIAAVVGGFSPALQVQEEPPVGQVTAGNDRSSALRIQLSGETEIYFVSRDSSINDAGDTLNAPAAPTTPLTNFWAGRLSVRMDVSLKDQVSAVLEFANRPYDEGSNIPLGTNPPGGLVHFQQAYIDVSDLVLSGLSMRLGLQEVTLRNRPHDEPFFLALGDSEGFFEGLSPSGTFLRNTVDRDIRQATGVRMRYDFNEGMSAQAMALAYPEGDLVGRFEQVYLATLNARPTDNLATWILFAWVTGVNRDEQVWTLGWGVDAYVGTSKSLELFAEAYYQGGSLAPDVRKEAYAFNAGFRTVDVGFEGLWVEGACSLRSGERQPGGRIERTFQSYENENRFLILQSAEFGLDVDVNVFVVRLAVGCSPARLSGRPLHLQLDVGNFTGDQPILDPTGGHLAGSSRHWGVEVDGTASWNYNESLTFRLQVAGLTHSPVLEALTPGRDRGAILLVAGADLKF
jgi:hypothetical protein